MYTSYNKNSNLYMCTINGIILTGIYIKRLHLVELEKKKFCWSKTMKMIYDD